MQALIPVKLPGGSIGRELQKTLFPNEQVLAYAQGKFNQLLLATDQRVIIVKGAAGSGGAFFGTTSLSLFYSQITSIQVRKQFGDGFVEVSSPGVQNIQRGRAGQVNAPNIVPFNAWDEKRFREVVAVIQQQLQRYHTMPMMPQQNIVIAVGEHAAASVTQPTVQTTPVPNIQPSIVVATPVMPPTPPKPLYQFKLWEIIAISVTFILGWALNSVEIGPIFIIAAFSYTFYRDWRGACTLRDLINWNSMSDGTRLWVIIGLVMIYPLAFFVYLWRAFSDWDRQRKEAIEQRPQQIALLEAQLGIMPATDGECRECHKPLQVGAEFCAFCGIPVVEKPLVCANCATTVLPGAAFCPKCRTELTPIR